MTTDRSTAENLTMSRASDDPAPDHPRPSTIEAEERSHLRRALDDETQRKVWLGFYVGMALLLVLGVAFGLRQHTDTGEALPPPPPAAR
jgi:hypothetical protein